MNKEGPTPDGPAPSTARPANAPPIRWWPAAVIVVLAVLAAASVWFTHGHNHQQRNLGAALVVIVAGFLLLLWGLFLSRLRWRVRWLGLLLLTALGLAAVGLFRIRGVTGDLLPVFEWRWKTARAVVDTDPTAARSPLAPERNSPEGLSYPQFLGPARTAKIAGLRLERDWEKHPPELVWRHAVGAAWSGFAVVGEYAITQEQQGEEEWVVAYRLRTGERLWRHTDPGRYQTTLAGVGPRATPTIADGRVYAVGAKGRLNCLELATGRRLWSKDLLADNQAGLPSWGVSGSPLVWNGWVIVNPGGREGRTLAAYRADNGEFVWGGGHDGAAYSSPLLVSLGGAEQLLNFGPGAIAGYEARTGRLLWEYPWPRDHPHVAMPVVLKGDAVLVSSGYGKGSELIEVRREDAGKWTATRRWKTTRLKAKFTNVVEKDGYIYGLDDGSLLVCLEAATGELKWKEGRYGHGQVILVEDLLLVMAESGEVVLTEPTPAAFRELGRLRVFNRKTWNPPALAGSHLVVRHDAEAACYRLPLAGLRAGASPALP